MKRGRGEAGFSAVELLIVVVIIGILAAVAIPKFASTKEKAYLASMKSDLRNLATTQEGYFADNTAYFSGTGTNRGSTQSAVQGFVPSAGVQVVASATGGTGWSAIASHSQTSKTCSIFIGVSAVSPATVDGEPKCT